MKVETRISEVTPTLLRETVSKSTSDALKQYMYSTVTGGTAVTAKVDGYSMGGKTGTAQKAGRDGVNYLVSFIGFAPVEDPRLSFTVLWMNRMSQNSSTVLMHRIL